MQNATVGSMGAHDQTLKPRGIVDIERLKCCDFVRGITRWGSGRGYRHQPLFPL
ncbi:uncharacterized protein CTRU02_215594 [Colletotrichum truncatum]|uniref:Uncharacterized protein n=1 Tax=Colletotrichum truncatum TaxID=5467 RepID=A0ACC3YCA0_COLTU|nr:uncharacterized protein CTRU02_05472 [Colletotrichum truncatum]KAF6793915.1 hypothetical protein CTRU02_05472 [Colletotrichum truncatum]